MASYIEESLNENETIQDIFKIHWLTWAWVWFLVLLGPLTLGITLVIGVYKWLVLRNLEQGVTSKRVIFKAGIISRKTEEMKLSSIETIEIKQGVLGRIFGFGNVQITGRGISDLVFPNIDNPMKVKKTIESLDG